MSKPLRSSNTTNNMNSGYIKTGYIQNIPYETDTTIFRPLVNNLKSILNIESDLLKFRFNTHQDEFYYLYNIAKDSGLNIFTEANFTLEQELFPLVGKIDDEIDLSLYSIGLGDVELDYNRDILPLNYEIIDNKIKINKVGVSFVSYKSTSTKGAGRLRIVGVYQLPRTFRFYPIINLTGKLFKIETNIEYDLRSFFRSRPYELYLNDLEIKTTHDVDFISKFKFKSNVDGDFSINIKLEETELEITFNSSSLPTPLISELPNEFDSGTLISDYTNLYFPITPNVIMNGSMIVNETSEIGYILVQNPVTKDFKVILINPNEEVIESTMIIDDAPEKAKTLNDEYKLEYPSNIVLMIDEEKLVSEIITITKNGEIVMPDKVSAGQNFKAIASIVSGNRIKANNAGIGVLIIETGNEVAEISVTVIMG